MTWVLRTTLPLDAFNLRLADCEAAGLLGAAEEDGATSAYFPARVDGLGIPGDWEEVPERDWSTSWRESLRPVRVGNLVICPPWHATGDGSEIVIDPGQAFGTGHHETTSGCLAALQEHPLAGQRLLDLGTGSGVLAIAAVRLGAAVTAVDNDPEAVRAARRNAAANGVRLDVREGSLEAAGTGPFDVIVANLDTGTLSTLALPLARTLAPRGLLIASGVSRAREREAVDALRAAGLAVEVRPGSEWIVLLGAHAGPAPSR